MAVAAGVLGMSCFERYGLGNNEQRHPVVELSCFVTVFLCPSAVLLWNARWPSDEDPSLSTRVDLECSFQSLKLSRRLPVDLHRWSLRRTEAPHSSCRHQSLRRTAGDFQQRGIHFDHHLRADGAESFHGGGFEPRNLSIVGQAFYPQHHPADSNLCC